MSHPDVRVVDPSRVAGWRSYLELTKPRIVELLLITTVPAMVVAHGGWPSTWLVAATVLGGALSAGGANAINQVIDRDIDQLMSRTRRRPLPSGRILPGRALAFGIALGAAGFGWLWSTANLAAAVLATIGLVLYVFVYTIGLKRSSAQNIVLGGAAGAVPTLVGWAAVSGSLDVAAWVMFAVVFFWTPAHFWALAIRYRDDYRAAGVPMLPVVVGERDTLEQILRYSVIAVGTTLLLAAAAPVGWWYIAGASALGLVLMLRAARLRRDWRQAMSYFAFTNVYLAGVFVAVALDAVIGVPASDGVRAVVGAGGGALALVGGSVTVAAELRMRGRRLVGTGRDVIEVVAPLAGLVALVAAVALG
jgi:protoheme IX farnesyltransferase